MPGFSTSGQDDASERADPVLPYWSVLLSLAGQNVEREIRHRLAAAEAMLWEADVSADYTTIGHKLREAVQQFATELIARHQVTDVQADPAKTKNRLRAVVESQRHRLGTSKADLLKALAEYQDVVNDLVQRQEHGDQKPGDPLTWEERTRGGLPYSFTHVRVRPPSQPVMRAVTALV